MSISFDVVARDSGSRARAGVIHTPHGAVPTPAFVTVGTAAAVKSLTPDEVRSVGGSIILANTYHLYLRPGDERVAHFGGLHGFMGWDGPLMTDSGGFQVFSLGAALEHGVGKMVSIFPGADATRPARPVRPRLTTIDEDGVMFTSFIDGSRHRFTPERSIAIQENLGADLILAFDECTSPLAGEDYTRQAMERTHRWAERCLVARRRPDQALFGIIQGGAYRDLRERSAAVIGGMPFEGLAVGGSLGKSKNDMRQILAWTMPLLPPAKPVHMLGIGDPLDFFPCIEHGLDTFDCVSPTRLARHGVLLTRTGRLTIKNARYRDDDAPIEAGCHCPTCARYSRGYLRHLLVAGELLYHRLASLHNLAFTIRLVAGIRAAIIAGHYAAFRDDFLAGWQPRGAASAAGG
ncbi:MAG: tRNA guanosine(34) transglycosylase Tgt [Chloroflexi bacterium]|nr:tRNA guanosine(34) transglycosylase Tgt [Chloroflexota bacterium]